MVENGFSHRTGFLWGVLFPWVAALPLLYQPNALNQFINFSSLVFVSFTDFIVPCELPAAFFVVAMLPSDGDPTRLPLASYCTYYRGWPCL